MRKGKRLSRKFGFRAGIGAAILFPIQGKGLLSMPERSLVFVVMVILIIASVFMLRDFVRRMDRGSVTEWCVALFLVILCLFEIAIAISAWSL